MWLVTGFYRIFQGVAAVNSGIDYTTETVYNTYTHLTEIPENRKRAEEIKKDDAARNKYRETGDKIKEKYAEQLADLKSLNSKTNPDKKF